MHNLVCSLGDQAGSAVAVLPRSVDVIETEHFHLVAASFLNIEAVLAIEIFVVVPRMVEF